MSNKISRPASSAIRSWTHKRSSPHLVVNLQGAANGNKCLLKREQRITLPRNQHRATEHASLSEPSIENSIPLCSSTKTALDRRTPTRIEMNVGEIQAKNVLPTVAITKRPKLYTSCPLFGSCVKPGWPEENQETWQALLQTTHFMAHMRLADTATISLGTSSTYSCSRLLRFPTLVYTPLRKI